MHELGYARDGRPELNDAIYHDRYQIGRGEAAAEGRRRPRPDLAMPVWLVMASQTAAAS